MWLKIAAGTGVFALVVWGLIAIFSKHPQDYAMATVSLRDLTETVTGNGTVEPDQQVSLAFNMQGLVNYVSVNVGDTVKKGQVLASLDASSLSAQLDGAKADLMSAQANLALAKKGARPEELAIYAQKYSDASSAFITAMKNAYLENEDAVLNKADMVFVNGPTANPTINIRTQSQAEQLSINSERISISDKLNTWKQALSAVNSTATSSDQIKPAMSATDAGLSAVKSFTDHLGTIAGNLSVGNSGMSQSAIDTVVAAVNGAAQESNNAATAEQAAEATWSNARDSLALEEAGSTPEAIQSAQAAEAKAQANVEALQSQLYHSYLIAPFDGIVTNADLKVGQVFVPGISSNETIGLMSSGDFKVEILVPETDIGKIAVGDKAAITLDAYGPSQDFPAAVSLIDPAETVQNGVNSYKVTLRFDNAADARIKSGLSANVSITAKSVSSAIAVPASSIITKGSGKYVLVKDPKSAAFAEKKVTIGIESADGYVEILSGLNTNDTVADFGSAN
ncbi:MAG: efflux RND transporter periplasmic adaptor subunit [Patescibacteria group bacterium]|nr:efflux RND transporter periplasmic adaptor subunit [Patescibacteria group bacterium]